MQKWKLPAQSILLVTLFLMVSSEAGADYLCERSYGALGATQGYGMAKTSDGGYVLTGSANQSLDEYWEATLTKLDSSLNFQWQREYDFPDYPSGEYGFDVKQTFDGGYIIVGSTQMYSASANDNWVDLLVIKTDSQGYEQCIWTKDGADHVKDEAYSVNPNPGWGFCDYRKD